MLHLVFVDGLHKVQGFHHILPSLFIVRSPPIPTLHFSSRLSSRPALREIDKTVPQCARRGSNPFGIRERCDAITDVEGAVLIDGEHELRTLVKHNLNDQGTSALKSWQ